MNRKGANPAVMPAKTPKDLLSVKCMTLFAHPAENPAKFLSSPEMTVRYTAAIVLQTVGNFGPSSLFCTLFGAYFFYVHVNILFLKMQH